MLETLDESRPSECHADILRAVLSLWLPRNRITFNPFFAIQRSTESSLHACSQSTATSWFPFTRISHTMLCLREKCRAQFSGGDLPHDFQTTMFGSGSDVRLGPIGGPVTAKWDKRRSPSIKNHRI